MEDGGPTFSQKSKEKKKQNGRWKSNFEPRIQEGNRMEDGGRTINQESRRKKTKMETHHSAINSRRIKVRWKTDITQIKLKE